MTLQVIVVLVRDPGLTALENEAIYSEHRYSITKLPSPLPTPQPVIHRTELEQPETKISFSSCKIYISTELSLKNLSQALYSENSTGASKCNGLWEYLPPCHLALLRGDLPMVV